MMQNSTRSRDCLIIFLENGAVISSTSFPPKCLTVHWDTDQ